MQDHLERYSTLIMFSAFLAAGSTAAQQSFETFAAGLPEVQSALQHLVRQFPLLSLEVDDSASDNADRSAVLAVRTMHIAFHLSLLAASPDVRCVSPRDVAGQ